MKKLYENRLKQIIQKPITKARQKHIKNVIQRTIKQLYKKRFFFKYRIYKNNYKSYKKNL